MHLNEAKITVFNESKIPETNMAYTHFRLHTLTLGPGAGHSMIKFVSKLLQVSAGPRKGLAGWLPRVPSHASRGAARLPPSAEQRQPARLQCLQEKNSPLTPAWHSLSDSLYNSAEGQCATAQVNIPRRPEVCFCRPIPKHSRQQMYSKPGREVSGGFGDRQTDRRPGPSQWPWGCEESQAIDFLLSNFPFLKMTLTLPKSAQV